MPADAGPAFMFDAEQVGFRALSWDKLVARPSMAKTTYII